MLPVTLAARARRRKPRTHEAERYRLSVRDVLPHVPLEDRPHAALLMQWHPFAVEAVSRAHGQDLPGLSCAVQTFGARWYFTCPKCGRRCAFLYWQGWRDVGAWRCRVCLGLKYTSSAQHRTIQGDWEALSRGPVASWAAYQRASKRQRRRWARLVRQAERML